MDSLVEIRNALVLDKCIGDCLLASQNSQTLKHPQMVLLHRVSLGSPLSIKETILQDLEEELLEGWAWQLIHTLVRNNELVYQGALLCLDWLGLGERLK